MICFLGLAYVRTVGGTKYTHFFHSHSTNYAESQDERNVPSSLRTEINK